MRSLFLILLFSSLDTLAAGEGEISLPFEYIVVPDKNESEYFTPATLSPELPNAFPHNYMSCAGVISIGRTELDSFFSKPNQTWHFKTTYETWIPIDGVVKKYEVWSIK